MIKTTITYLGETKEFDNLHDLAIYIQGKNQEPKITVKCEGFPEEYFGNLNSVIPCVQHRIYLKQKSMKEQYADELFTAGVKTVYNARLVLEYKFNLWVAKSRQSRYNIRKKEDWSYKPFVFGGKEMFGLTGKELLKFYDRYTKVIILAE